MRIAKAWVVAVMLLGFGVAHADEVVRVERRHSTAGIVLKDTVAGGLVGSAVAGGVILYNMGIQGEDNYDWGRTLAWGAVIGLGAGLVWGVVDAASASDNTYAARAPVRDGQSLTMNRGRDQSGKTTMALLSGHF
ncbi:hypothetical protein [Anaeromyxobacter terrae]|uniref:hypothetical protein n=1 Tax=Anaeromyxobacter terrae TaxID=2925406 RepID=UPI001F57B63E|nr:hypothetical protein [Anaeromyxobacter sp. SG22]